MRRHPASIVCGYFLIVLVFLTGCVSASGIKYDFANVALDVSASGRSSIAIATHDQRAYVVSGRKRPNFVGLQRAGYGNPYNVTTKSDGPFADEVTAVVAAALSKKGFQAVPIPVSFRDESKNVMEKVKAADADRIIVTTLKEWKSDVFLNVALSYDVTLTVFNGSGRKLGEKNIRGRDNLSGDARHPWRDALTVVPAALKEKLEELLNSKEIAPFLMRGESERNR